MRRLALVTYRALVEKSAAPSAIVAPVALARPTPAELGVAPMAKTGAICQSCKDERQGKGVPPMEKVILPAEVTAEGFFKPIFPTIVCPYCDGETLVASALRASKERQGK